MTDLDVVIRLTLSAAMAGTIGSERERHGRAAGFRTHILVGLGSCIVMLTGVYLFDHLGDRVAIDPTRMGSQVVSGIGFLGAGTILRFRASIRGLTTAASLWVAAGIGLAAGAGFLLGALTSTVLALVALYGLARWERRLRREWYRVLVVETRGNCDDLAAIRRVLSEHDVEIQDFEIRRADQPDTAAVELHVRLVSSRDEDDILSKTLRQEGTRRAHWT
ncbi:MAG: MgtC/SapB family protein [Candidatus Omnitrophica bacterium]|nr:MgtC/SapB family protein [Candidatus Omnitrophota bacterium]